MHPSHNMALRAGGAAGGALGGGGGWGGGHLVPTMPRCVCPKVKGIGAVSAQSE